MDLRSKRLIKFQKLFFMLRFIRIVLASPARWAILKGIIFAIWQKGN